MLVTHKYWSSMPTCRTRQYEHRAIRRILSKNHATGVRQHVVASVSGDDDDAHGVDSDAPSLATRSDGMKPFSRTRASTRAACAFLPAKAMDLRRLSARGEERRPTCSRPRWRSWAPTRASLGAASAWPDASTRAETRTWDREVRAGRGRVVARKRTAIDPVCGRARSRRQKISRHDARAR